MQPLILTENQSIDFSELSISSDRIRLLPLQEEFADIIFEVFDNDITRYMTPSTPSSISDIYDFIQQSNQAMIKGAELAFAITDINTNEFLGICNACAKSKPKTPELGVWIKKSAWGCKYGFEAISLLVEWFRSTIQYEYLIYPVDKANTSSRKIPERLGGKIIEEKPLPTQAGCFLDGVVYKIE